MRKNYFDDPVAQRYDADSADRFEPEVIEPTVSFLADLAGQGPRPAAGPKGSALEFGIGTGRVALPLSQRGIHVHGIDLSPDMVAQLKAKPGGEAIEVTIGDFASATADKTFRLAYLVYNTIANLTSQDDQVACFRNAAAHLRPGGFFVIEVGVPQLQRLPPGETVRPFTVTAAHLGFDEFDIARQGLVSHHYWVQDGEFRMLSMPFRYVWPGQRTRSSSRLGRLGSREPREHVGAHPQALFSGDGGVDGDLEDVVPLQFELQQGFEVVGREDADDLNRRGCRPVLGDHIDALRVLPRGAARQRPISLSGRHGWTKAQQRDKVHDDPPG